MQFAREISTSKYILVNTLQASVRKSVPPAVSQLRCRWAAWGDITEDDRIVISSRVWVPLLFNIGLCRGGVSKLHMFAEKG